MDTIDDKTPPAPKALAKDETPPAAAQEAPRTKEDTAKAAAVDALVEQWLAPLRGGDIAQHTPAWNALTASLPALKAAIIKHGG